MSSHTVTLHHILPHVITYSHMSSHTATCHHIQSHIITYSHTSSHTVTRHHMQPHTSSHTAAAAAQLATPTSQLSVALQVWMQYLYDQLKASKASGGPLAGVMPWSAVLSSQWDTDGYGIKLDSYKPGEPAPAPAPGPAPVPAPKLAPSGKAGAGKDAPKPAEAREEGGEQVEEVQEGGSSGRRRLSWVQEKLDSFRRAEVSDGGCQLQHDSLIGCHTAANRRPVRKAAEDTNITQGCSAGMGVC